jgi:hypothetical protein
VNVHDGLRVRAGVDRHMHRRLAGCALIFFDRLARLIDADEILRREKAQRRVLPGD